MLTRLVCGYIISSSAKKRDFFDGEVEQMFDVRNAIRARMYERGISQSELSRRTGIRPDSMCRTLNGYRKLTADEYILICRELQITTDELELYDPALSAGLTLSFGGVK